MADRDLRGLAREAAGDPGVLKRLGAARCRAGVHRFEWGLMCLDCEIDISAAMQPGDPGILPAWQRSASFTVEITLVEEVGRRYRAKRGSEAQERREEILAAIDKEVAEERAACEEKHRLAREANPWLYRLWTVDLAAARAELLEDRLNKLRADLAKTWGLE